MPRRLPEKTRYTRRTRRFSKRRRSSASTLIRRAPVREGQELDVTIDDVSSKGDAISRIGSFAIYVPQARVGERLKVRIIRVSRNFAIAEKIV